MNNLYFTIISFKKVKTADVIFPQEIPTKAVKLKTQAFVTDKTFDVERRFKFAKKKRFR